LEVKKRILADPYNVKPADLRGYSPEIQLYAIKNCFIYGKVTNSRTLVQICRDQVIDEQISKNGFIIHPLKVRSFLKWCKEHGKECLVLNTISGVLQDSANYRNANLLKIKQPVLLRSDITKCLLSPYFDITEHNRVVIRGVLPDTMNRILSNSGLIGEDGRDFDIDTLPILAWSMATYFNQVWFVQELIDCFSLNDLALNDEGRFICVGDIHPPTGRKASLQDYDHSQVAWCVTGSGTPALYFSDEEVYQRFLSYIPPEIPRLERSIIPLLPSEREQATTTISKSSIGGRVVEVQDCFFMSFYKSIRDRWGDIYNTAAFRDFIERRRQQEVQLALRSKFNELLDYPLKIKNSDLAKKLYPHQRVAVEWILRNKSAFIGDDMGLGKTLAVLTAFEELLCQGEVEKGLIVCPNSLCFNWNVEVQRWFTDVFAVVLPKSPAQRKKILYDFANEDQCKLLVVNYEIVRTLGVQTELKEVFGRFKTFLCIDESQRVKNPFSKTFLMLKDLALTAQRRILLSGTPTPKSISDIWSQMFLLDFGERFGDDYLAWLKSIALLGNDYSAYAVRQFYNKPVQYTRQRVQEVLLRRRKEFVIDLPEKIFSDRNVELSGAQLQRYEEVRKDLKVRLMSIKGKVFTREISSILEQYLRAVQIASNPRLVDPTWVGTPAKFKELDYLIEELVGEGEQKVVIWTNYVANTLELKERYARYGIGVLSGSVKPAVRHCLVKGFQENEGAPRIIVALPAVAGVGLTLTRASCAIYLDKTWNAEHWFQSVDRLHRIGQKKTVSVISLMASKVDRLISANLERKGHEQSLLLDRSCVARSFTANGLMVDDSSANDSSEYNWHTLRTELLAAVEKT
jgi:superfamily II DNA or RNA helicase